jgi:Adenine specific DNA methylase Mod
MAAIHGLLKQIADPALRSRLEEEYARMTQDKKFGLVFEEHIPECTPLYGVPVKRGSTVARKAEKKITDVFSVIKITDGVAVCLKTGTDETVSIPVEELVSVAKFGEAIFPTLQPVDSVENAPDRSLWHTLIEADNYHALQLLEYLYPNKVDCIYIDPPYNTGARDWKYNNDYVDSADGWRHSKWLSMMQKRLKLAKHILNPDTGVLIVTIDENEVHHLRMLLDELFPTALIQMITVVINPKGIFQGKFSRVEEYAIFCFMPNAKFYSGKDPLLGEVTPVKKPRWKGLLRSGSRAAREHTFSEFYPILVDAKSGRVVKALDPPSPEVHPVLGEKIDGYDVAWPIRSDGSEGLWGVVTSTLNALIEKGYVSLGRFDSKRKTWGLSYLTSGPQQQIESGELLITNFDKVKNVVEVEYADTKDRQMKTVWYRTLHDAGAYGSDLLSDIIGKSGAFAFPKSLYSTEEAIAAVVRKNPNALIVDFFAGSGTTLHAVNLLNAEDGGNRRCIIITNNEVSEAEANALRAEGHVPGDIEWESHGICSSVTWPRTKYSVLGKRDDGTMIDGEYFMSQSTSKNIDRAFHQISFADSTTLSTPAVMKQIIDMIGLPSGSKKAISRMKDSPSEIKKILTASQLPKNTIKRDTKFVVSDSHTVSILFDTDFVDDWIEALDGQEQITDLYIVTSDGCLFSSIKEKVINSIGTISVMEPLKRPMSDGFPANVEYFKLGFLDKDFVSLGRQFKEILPLLWLKSGAVGKRPEVSEDEPDMLILPQNRFAVLLDESRYAAFIEKLPAEGIDTIYFVTSSEDAFHDMSLGVKTMNTCQLYRDYVDNFVIGSRRNSR